MNKGVNGRGGTRRTRKTGKKEQGKSDGEGDLARKNERERDGKEETGEG